MSMNLLKSSGDDEGDSLMRETRVVNLSKDGLKNGYIRMKLLTPLCFIYKT